MKYVLLVNGGYINSFKTYSQACEVRDNFLRKGFINVEIEPIY